MRDETDTNQPDGSQDERRVWCAIVGADTPLAVCDVAAATGVRGEALETALGALQASGAVWRDGNLVGDATC